MEGAPPGKRRRVLDLDAQQAHEERIWRGVESATRADCLRGQSPGDGRHGSGTGATAAEYPSQKVRYAVAQHGWLRDENEHGARLPVIEVDLPFIAASRWGGTTTGTTGGDSRPTRPPRCPTAATRVEHLCVVGDLSAPPLFSY